MIVQLHYLTPEWIKYSQMTKYWQRQVKSQKDGEPCILIMRCYILISLTLSQLQAMCRHWADQRCHSLHKHELIWLWRHHKSLSGRSGGCQHICWEPLITVTTKEQLHRRQTVHDDPFVRRLSVVALMSSCALQIRRSALTGISLRITVTLVNDLYWMWPFVNSCVWPGWVGA